MNNKIYIAIGILILFALYICTGCSSLPDAKYTPEDLDNLAEIKIYSAGNDELIKTVSDEEQLYQYNHCSLINESDTAERQDELKENLGEAKAQYYFVTYKYPVARFGSRELKENTTITLYENTNIIKMTVSEEAIKAFSIPEEFLTFYCELSEEDIKFYHSLADPE